MNFPKLRNELRHFYLEVVDELSDKFCEKCTAVMDERAYENMSVYRQKVHQYQIITEMFEPVLFYNSPFYYEMGTMSAQCDGARDFRGGHSHAGGWTYWRNQHLFIEQNPELHKLKIAQTQELLYLICSYYFNDTNQHFSFNYRPVFEVGLKGIYEKAKTRLETAATDEERDFLNSVCEGLLCLKKISGKFAEKALDMAKSAPNEEARRNMELVAQSAVKSPWEKPQSFYEALNTYAFLRKTMGALEGVGFNSFGRVDIDLYPFYKNDIQNGSLSPNKAYELICKFLITFDLHYDHDLKFEGYSDHELENTYVLGGCDRDGNEVYNELTKMFLQATREEGIIFPKIKCRYSKNSPKEYLDEINKSILNGTSTVLYQNDDATIPAFVRGGRTIEEARDYIVAGCWDAMCPGVEKLDAGTYTNILKAFEFSIHRLNDKMEKVKLYFKPIDDSKSFEDVYNTTVSNFETLIKERNRIETLGGNMWDKVDVLPLFSSTLDSCIDKAKDYTAGGAKYHDAHYYCFGLPNVVDSLLAIKKLCFDTKKYTLTQFLNAVRCNWEGYEDMRLDALSCNGWGDGSEESNSLANRLNNDLYDIVSNLTSAYGGKVFLGHLTYTEIKSWGEKTLATPDGRKSGDYFSQGLTPSRLKKIPSVTSVINSMASLDKTTLAGNSVLNVILPLKKDDFDVCEAFLRATAGTAVQSLQLNCTTKEQLLDAQKHPEKYPELIVRVTGFSAKFTSLSPEWQDEVLTRNFYE